MRRHSLSGLIRAISDWRRAYKDFESVIVASATLVRPMKRLTPLGVVKG